MSTACRTPMSHSLTCRRWLVALHVAPPVYSVVTRVTTGRTWQHFLDEETDGAHVGGRSNTGCTDSITLPR